jgi:hypothetical protein
VVIVYLLSSPDDARIILTSSIAAVVAATKSAEEAGVVIEVGQWDTDKSSTLVLTLDPQTPQARDPGNPPHRVVPGV